MQAYRCRRALDKIDYELLWLLTSLGTFLAAAVWLAARLPTPRCAFHSLTGLPCVTCGATRSASQFLHGHFAASFLFNPLAFFAYGGVLIFDLYAIVILVTRAPRVRLGDFTPNEKLLARSVVIALLAGNWLYLLVARPFS